MEGGKEIFVMDFQNDSEFVGGSRTGRAFMRKMCPICQRMERDSRQALESTSL